MIREMLNPNSDVSSMRVAMFILIFAGIIIAIVGLVKGVDLGGLGILCGVFVGAAMGGKSLQAFSEKGSGGDK